MALQSWQYVQSEAEAGRVRDPIRALAEETGAGTVISGVVYLENDSLEIHVNVTDAVRGQPLGAVDPARGPQASPREVIVEAQQQVMGFLAVSFDERIAAHATGVAQPPSYEAYREFDQGLELYLRSTGFDESAISHFHRAFALDTTFVTPLLYAIFTHINNSQWAQADSLVGILESHRNRMSEYDLHWLDQLRANVDGDYPDALRAIRRAAELAPGAKAVYNRANMAMGNNRPQEALEALLSLDPERGPMRGWRGYMEVLLRVYWALEEYDKALEVAQQYRETYGDSPGSLQREGMALAAAGRVEEVNDLLNDLMAFPEQRYRILRIALFLRRHGHADAAQTTVDRAIKWYDSMMPETKSQSSWRWHYSLALYYADRCDEAYSVAKPLSEEFPESLSYRGLVGILAACRGDQDEALEMSQWLAALDRPYLRERHTLWRSAIAAALGDGENAVALFRRVLQARGLPRPWHFTWSAFESIHDYPPFQELMRPKG
jgi:tetratricopeptide (TPR) repeat protein